MKLKLFDFVEETATLFEKRQSIYLEIQKQVEDQFARLMNEQKELVVSFSSRIKSKKSLKEKIIRNKYYLTYETPADTLKNLSDVLGITLECRFIRDEYELYKRLFHYFEKTDTAFYQSKECSDLYLNLSQKQPQQQRNGFIIYRIDGYIVHQQERINFELQIKSLVHRFWSEIEHQVVYKNNNFIFYDHFMKNILSSILDNLEVVDHQLESVYRQISSEDGTQSEIGFGENGFKLFIAKSINDLVTLKMKETMGFTTNFKHCSEILSQYIFIRHFLKDENPQYRMAEYIEHFNLLKTIPLNFEEELQLEVPFTHDNPFCSVMGKYWEEMLNADYEWHIFFYMLFITQPGDKLYDFTQFIEVIKNLIFASVWNENKDDVEIPKEEIEGIVARELIKIGKIDIIHEEKLFDVSLIVKKAVTRYKEGKLSTVLEIATFFNQQLLILFCK